MTTPAFGTIRYGQSHWIIECEPHVKARLKRVFPRAPQEPSKAMQISATPENTRELEWFIQRFPMEVDRPDVLEQLAAAHRETEQRIAAVLAGHVPPPSIELALPPREYQRVAAQMLEVRGGFLLGDDLGLGKTVSAICGMVLPGSLPALVVCPAHLPRQWQSMINRFAPALRTHILAKSTVYDLAPRRGSPQIELLPGAPSAGLPDVIISSYHKLRGWAEHLAGQIALAVYDECQAMRSSGTMIYQACKLIADSSQRKMGLSATPIYNYGAEFFNVVDVLSPGCLGTREEFLREWCTGGFGDKAPLADARLFGAHLRREGIMLRRTRSEVGRELPELTKIVHDVDVDEVKLDELKGNAIELAKVILGRNEAYRGERMQASAEFDAMMRQSTGLAKAPYVVQFVELLLESGEPVVLFGWHRAVYDVWMERLAKHSPVLYTGTESATQKAAAIASFVSGQSRVLIMSLRSGAGVDGLQGSCNTVVFGELDWSPGVHEQCVGRVHRDGQDTACTAYFLVADSGADPIIAEVLGVKRQQIEDVRNPDGALIERVDIGENNIRRLAREFLDRRGVEIK